MSRIRSHFARYLPGRTFTFQSLLLWRLLALTLTSVTMVSFIGARFAGELLRENAARQLRDSAADVRGALGHYLDMHLKAVSALGESLQPGPRQTLTTAAAARGLEQTETIYPGFLTMLVTNADGKPLAAVRQGERCFILSGEASNPIADREYFRTARYGGKTFISDVFQGRGFGHDPIVAVSAPIRDLSGEVIGVVEGSIDIKRLPLKAEGGGVPPLVLAQDAKGTVVYSSRPDLHRALERWVPRTVAGTTSAVPGQPYVLLDRGDSQKAVRMTAVRLPLTIRGWQVTALQPMEIVEKDIWRFYRTIACLFTLVSILAWVTAGLIVRSVAEPIKSVAAAMRAYEFDCPLVPSEPAPSVVREIAQIQQEFRRLAHRLKDSWQELRTALGERDENNRQLKELLADLDRRVAERTAQLASSEVRYRQVVENSGDIIYRCDLQGNVTFHNAAFALLLGEDPAQKHGGKRIQDLLQPALKTKTLAAGRRQIRRSIPAMYVEAAIQTARGARRWIGQNTQLLIENGKAAGFQAIARDITEQKHAQQALRTAKERYALAVRGSNDGIWDWDLRTGEVYYSTRWKQMLGLREDMLCQTLEAWLSRVHPHDVTRLREELNAYAASGTRLFEREFRIYHADGTWRWVSTCGAAVRDKDGRALRIAGSQSDITPGKLTDPLCGLPNRLAILDRLERLFERYKEEPEKDFALLFLDVDRFKLINDSLGHQVGDELLIGVSRRIIAALRGCAPVNGCVGRLGGDEFVVLLDELPAPEMAMKVAEAILGTMKAPFHLSGTLVFSSTSIGIAFGSGPSSNAEDVLQNADAAMYHAKAGGRGQCSVFDRTMHARAIERLRLETDLRNALERAEFVLHYQPQVCLRTGRLTGFEALVRWRRNHSGLVSPSEFIPVAEETGLIVPLGRWVIEQACHEMAEWRKRFALDAVTISVNLSCSQFTDPELTTLIRQVLAQTDLPSSALRLEVTETVLADDPGSAQRILGELAAMGVGLEIDDFGTGYSSLSQLHRLPFDTLKVDRSFVQAMDREPECRKTIDSIASLAGSLGIGIVAEGIETAEHWLQLESIGCHVGQGYFFGYPSDAAATAELISLRHNRNWEKPVQPEVFASSLMALDEAASASHGLKTKT